MTSVLADWSVLGRFLGPGLAVAALLGIVSAFARGRRPGRAYLADLLVAGVLLVALAGVHLAAARDLLPLEGRPAFYADALCLHLAAYLASAVLTLAVLRAGRRSKTGEPSPAAATAG